jgi:hypothetical protein
MKIQTTTKVELKVANEKPPEAAPLLPVFWELQMSFRF